MKLNPGIERTVKWLNENGFETCDSGDGETHEFECDRTYPYVVVVCEPSKLAETADAVLALLRTKVEVQPLGEDSGEDAISLCAMYDPTDGFASIDVINVTDKRLFAKAN